MALVYSHLMAPVRPMTFSGPSFLWRVSTRYQKVAPRRGFLVFTVYERGFRQAPFRFLFEIHTGHPTDWATSSGDLFVVLTKPHYLNLHEPRIARVLIEIAQKMGWAARQHPNLVVEVRDGFQCLREYGFMIESANNGSPDFSKEEHLPCSH